MSTMPDLSSDNMVEKLKSEVKRIVVERMKEEAEQQQQKKSAEASGERAKGTFIIRMDEKGEIVTEAVDTDGSSIQLESYTVDPQELAKEEEEKRTRRAFITLLRMTVHLLLALQDEQKTPPVPITTPKTMDLSDLAEDVRLAVVKVFNSNKLDPSAGIPRQSIEDVLSSFRSFWPENVLPRSYFGQLEQVLVRLSREPTDGHSERSSRSAWDKEKGEKLIQFMRTIRGELATHLRQFYSKVADNSGLSGSSEPKPNRTPDEL